MLVAVRSPSRLLALLEAEGTLRTSRTIKVFRDCADRCIRRACIVTLLILLVSIAVLEYVLRRPDAAPGGETKTTEDREVAVPEASPQQSPNPTLAPALFRLGRAVEQFGRGPVPQPGQAEPATKEPKKV